MQYRVLTATLAFLLLTFDCYALSDTLRVPLGFSGAVLEPSQSSMRISSSRRAIQRVTIPGFSSTVSSANPALPCKLIYLALPPNVDEGTVKVIPGSYTTSALRAAYDVAPVPPPRASDDASYTQSAINGRNLQVYGRNSFYPREQVRLVNIGSLRSWKIAVLEFWPYAYNPASGRLRVIDSGEAQISYSLRADAAPALSDPPAAEMSGFIANQEEASRWYESASGSGTTADYVIITTAAIASASTELHSFASFQSLRGFTAKIITESEWGGGTGDMAAENIRKWLKANYLPLGIRYVLLIGNPTPANGDVPMKMLWPRRHFASYREAPSDYYYADLTGNWDLDNDGYSGEEPDDFGSGGIDRIPEVYVGRIPYYGSIADLNHILRKTIDYESNSQGYWVRAFLLAMKPLDSDTPSYQLGEQITRDILSPLHLQPDRVYDAAYDLNPTPEHFPCDYDTVQREWVNGAGLVFWMSHGSDNTAASVFYSSRCAFLNDTKPSIVYMASCSNGKPENSGNLGYSVLRQGGVSTFSASRVSWYYLGETDFTLSDSIGGLGYQYARFLLSSAETCARASYDARLAVPVGIWANHLVYNLYGDPSLAYNSPAPGSISGKVLALDSTPIAGAVIETSDGFRSTESLADGSYRLEGLPDRAWDIIISADGFRSQRFYGVPATRGTSTRIDCRLASAVDGIISGCVRDPGGAPVFNALVTLSNAGRSAYSQHDGTFAFGGVSPGECTLTVSKQPYAQKVIPDLPVADGRVIRLDVTLRSSTANLLLNGGFEEGFIDGIASGWRAYSTSGYPCEWLSGTDFFRTGRSSQKLRLPQPNKESQAGLYQTINVAPGRTYRLICWNRGYSGEDEGVSSENLACRMGCDPTGGGGYPGPAVVWSAFLPVRESWTSAIMDITPRAETMTIYLDACRDISTGAGDCYAWFDAVSLYGPIDAPSVPLVEAINTCQSDTAAVSATWACSDPNVIRYEYAVSKTIDSDGIVPGGEWTSIGAATSGTRSGLALHNGDSVRVLVRAVNYAGVVSEPGASEPVRIVRDEPSAGSAKLQPDGIWVRIPDLRLTRMGEGPECYLQDLNRCAAIRVTGTWGDIAYCTPGTRVGVVGQIATENAMRVLRNARMMPSAADPSPKPLGMPNKLIGQCTNIGLLVTTWGQVTGVSDAGFIISDGSRPSGLTVKCHDSVPAPALGSYVRVTGISSAAGVDIYNSGDIRKLR